MFFRQDSNYEGLKLNRRSDPASFEVHDDHEIVVALRPSTPEEVDRLSHKQGVSRARVQVARAEALVEFDPPAKILAAFKALDERRLPDDSPPRGEWPRDFGYISEDLKIEGSYVVPAMVLSQGLQEFIRQTEAELRRATRLVFETVRWRLALRGPHDPVQFGTAYWSMDGVEWERLARLTSVSLSDWRPPRIDRREADVQALVDVEAREPLAHALWHEASQQRSANPRSALLIGISALEVGIKHYAAVCIPDAEWLILEAQSPPIVRLLAEFLPGLQPPQGKGFSAPDKDTLDTIRKGVHVRNEVTHKGVAALKPGFVDRVLSTVRRLLWQLDAAAGMDWAGEYAAEPKEGGGKA